MGFIYSGGRSDGKGKNYTIKVLFLRNEDPAHQSAALS
jgi:hypothetical protein